MIKSVNNYPVSQLFDTDSSIIYVIPRYQREYTWKRDQWENLFDDIIENNPNYFLGSIICINQSVDTMAVQELELVDGQQRLTTLSLLFAAIYKSLKERENSLDDEQRLELINLKRKLVLRRDSSKLRVIPQIQNKNFDDYRAVLAEIEVTSPFPRQSFAGLRKIFRAFDYFSERIAGLSNDPEKSVLAILALLDKVTQACLVKIEVDSHADAYTLFESLNNRGIPLTPVDLIKNKLLAKLESVEKGSMDHHFGEWNRILGYLGDDYTIQERFFRQYYNAFRDELKDIYQVPVATRSNLIQIYEAIIEKDAKDFLRRLDKACRLYAPLLGNTQEETSTDLRKPLQDLERIQGAPSYLLMLYLMVRQKQLQLSNKDLAEIIKLLVRFFVRRNLTDTPPTRDLTRLFMSIIDKLNGLTGEGIIKAIQQQLLDNSAPDLIFRTKLEGPIYEENFGVTRFVLCALEEQYMTKETWRNLWETENKHSVWTVEHIFPQGENVPKAWVETIAAGNFEKARMLQQTHVHKLGNLTISGFNSALGTKSFEEKRDRTDRQGNAIGYKNGLKLNQDLAMAETWSVEQIDVRTNKLVEKVLKLFNLDSVTP